MHSIARLALGIVLFSTLYSDCKAQSPSLETLLENHLAAEVEFDSACSSLDTQLRSATTAAQIATAFDSFNQSADKVISVWKELFAAIKTISQDKKAFIHSRDYALTDWEKLKKGTHLFGDALTKYTGLSAQALDNVRQFLGNSRVYTACQEAQKVEGRLQALGKDGEELVRMSKEWREEEAHPSTP